MTAEPDSKPTARFNASLETGLACFDLYDEAQVADRDGGTNGRGHLLTALSGGPDSTALALLAEHYACPGRVGTPNPCKGQRICANAIVHGWFQIFEW